ncbi:MAG: PH domain-containing protein [Muribaculaceae bacterium]|nr:PH domain-containing protein [Muribaculaceae bacterium]
MTDFSKPQRMGFSAFLIIFIKALKGMIGAVSIYTIIIIIKSDFVWSESSTWWTILSWVGIIIGFALIAASAAYYSFKFYIKDGNLMFTHGIIQRLTTTIPLDKIHSLRTKQGLWYRLLDMRGIVFDTLASKGAEVELILDESDWINLKRLIDKEERPKAESENEPPPFNPTLIKKFDNIDLLKDALCQNHLKALAIVAGFIALVLEKLDDLIHDYIDAATDYTIQKWNEFSVSPTYILVALIILYMILLIISVGRILIRYYDMSLSYDSKFLSFNYGMISRSTNRFSYDKICTLWTKQNALEKRFKLSTLMLKQALNASAMKEEDKLKLYGADSSNFYLEWWLGKDYRDSEEIATAQSGRGVMMHSIIYWLLISLVATAILCYYHEYVFIAIPAILLIYSIIKGWCAMRRSKIILKDSHVEISNGIFADAKNYLKYHNIEVVRISRTPFTRFFHRVSIVLSTSGSSFSIKSLKEKEAEYIYEVILCINAQRTMDNA